MRLKAFCTFAMSLSAMRGIASGLRPARSLLGPSRPHQPARPPHIQLSRNLSSRPPNTGDPASPSLTPSTPSDARPQSIPSSATRYLPSLTALSQRTGAPVPSLAISFVVLHELTAIVPLGLLYWIFAALGTGASVVAWVEGLVPPPLEGEESSGSPAGVGEQGGGGEGGEGRGGEGWKGVVRGWYDEGEKRIARVGRRYGILGYSKDDRAGHAEDKLGGEVGQVGRAGSKAGEKVANALAAYIVVKASRHSPAKS